MTIQRLSVGIYLVLLSMLVNKGISEGIGRKEIEKANGKKN